MVSFFVSILFGSRCVVPCSESAMDTQKTDNLKNRKEMFEYSYNYIESMSSV